MDPDSTRKALIQTVRQQGEIPSVRSLLKISGITGRTFYKSFPGGIEELSRASGVKVNRERVETMKPVVEARRSQVERTVETCITLTTEQTKRVLGASHLEGGLDQGSIIDEMLERDTRFRRYGLSLKQCRAISDLLDGMIQQGWTPVQVADYLTQHCNTWSGLGVEIQDMKEYHAEMKRKIEELQKEYGKTKKMFKANYVRQGTGIKTYYLVETKFEDIEKTVEKKTAERLNVLFDPHKEQHRGRTRGFKPWLGRSASKQWCHTEGHRSRNVRARSDGITSTFLTF